MKFYFESVLGVQAVYSEVPNIKMFRVYVEGFESYTTEETELFEKILGSIGLDRSSIQTFSDHGTQTDCDLYFMNSPSDELNRISSPKAMLADLSLKKLAWEKLRKVVVS